MESRKGGSLEGLNLNTSISPDNAAGLLRPRYPHGVMWAAQFCLSFPAESLSQHGLCIPPSIPEPTDLPHSQPGEIPPGPGTYPLASSFLRQTQQQQSRESRRMSSSARRAPAPITPILWLASARQTQGSAQGQPRGRAQPWPLALTHVAGAGQGVAGAVVAAADVGTVGSVAPGRASQVTAGGKGWMRKAHPPPQARQWGPLG